MAHVNGRGEQLPFIRTKGQCLMAEALIDQGTMECALDPRIMARAADNALSTARRYLRYLKREGVLRAWFWEIDDGIYAPSVTGPDGRSDYLWLPGPNWHEFVNEAQALGLTVRPLKEVK